MRGKRGQVWVETVIYISIGLVLIGLVLTIINPRINEFQDRIVIDQTIDSLQIFDAKINEVLAAPGNVRIIEFVMKRGDFYLDGANNQIRFELDDSRSLYSEPGQVIEFGKIDIETTERAKFHNVRLSLDYNDIDLKINGADSEKKFSAVSVPYRFQIEHTGFTGGTPVIDISEIS